MRKFIAILLVTLMFAALLTGCAAPAPNMYFAGTEMAPETPAAEAPAGAPMPPPPRDVMLSPEEELAASWDMGFVDDEAFVAHSAPFMPEVDVLPDAPPPEFPPEDPEPPAPPQTGGGDGFAERIIHSASANIETLEFDETIEAVYQMLAANGGFIEFSEIGGRNQWDIWHNVPTTRHASFTLRIPQERLTAVTGNLEALGNVLFINHFAENITAQFVDAEVRLSTLQVQEERLLYMLRRAEEISDMIEIEQRLGDVRFQIESIIANLRNWENMIRFSTLRLWINEVHVLTEVEEFNVPYWQQVWNGLMNTFRNIGQFFMNLLMWLIVNLPTLIIIAVVIVIALLIVIRITRKNKKRIKNAKDKLKSIPKSTMDAIAKNENNNVNSNTEELSTSEDNDKT